MLLSTNRASKFELSVMFCWVLRAHEVCTCWPAGEMSRSLDCIINRLQLALACIPIQQNQLLAQELVRGLNINMLCCALCCLACLSWQAATSVPIGVGGQVVHHGHPTTVGTTCSCTALVTINLLLTRPPHLPLLQHKSLVSVQESIIQSK
jgi:hypothetical protein